MPRPVAERGTAWARWVTATGANGSSRVFLGRHCSYFTALIAEATGTTSLHWLDFEFNAADWLGDGESLGLSFLGDSEVLKAFRAWWPHGSGIMNWDAVELGQDSAGSDCWILVEAKGNIPELGSNCSAGPTTLARISDALNETKKAFGALQEADWTRGYYQHANRLAVPTFSPSTVCPRNW